jgi:hypothetical protein
MKETCDICGRTVDTETEEMIICPQGIGCIDCGKDQIEEDYSIDLTSYKGEEFIF